MRDCIVPAYPQVCFCKLVVETVKFLVLLKLFASCRLQMQKGLVESLCIISRHY
jgi:hypothetical protein